MRERHRLWPLMLKRRTHGCCVHSLPLDSMSEYVPGSSTSTEFPSLFDGITIISRLQKCAIFQLECVWMWEEGRTDAFSWFYLSLSSSTPALFMHVRCPTLRPSNLQGGKRALCVEQSGEAIISMMLSVPLWNVE